MPQAPSVPSSERGGKETTLQSLIARPFIHSPHACLLCPYFVSGWVVCPENTTLNKQTPLPLGNSIQGDRFIKYNMQHWPVTGAVGSTGEQDVAEDREAAARCGCPGSHVPLSGSQQMAVGCLRQKHFQCTQDHLLGSPLWEEWGPARMRQSVGPSAVASFACNPAPAHGATCLGPHRDSGWGYELKYPQAQIEG